MVRHSKLLIGLVILFFSTSVFFQDFKELVPVHYTVVTAYVSAQESMARRHVDVLKGEVHATTYGYNSSCGSITSFVLQYLSK